MVNKAEIYVFLELSCFFHDPANVGNLISGSSAFSKTSLNIWKFTVHILLKPGLENFEHYFTSMWDGCNCVVVWAFFGIAFLWDWNANWLFPVLWPLLSFPNLLGPHRVQLWDFHGSPSPKTWYLSFVAWVDRIGRRVPLSPLFPFTLSFEDSYPQIVVPSHIDNRHWSLPTSWSKLQIMLTDTPQHHCRQCFC